jgi:hypothetical protein
MPEYPPVPAPSPGRTTAPGPPPLVEPHFESVDRDEFDKAPPNVQVAIRAYRELVRVARDPSGDPALPHVLSVLREAEPGLRESAFEVAAARDRSRTYRDRVASLPMGTLEAIRAADEAEGRLAEAQAAYRVAYAQWAEVYLALHPGNVQEPGA